jgi:hypothetical protein
VNKDRLEMERLIDAQAARIAELEAQATKLVAARDHYRAKHDDEVCRIKPTEARIAALEAKCALLAASLAQAEREKDEAEKHAAEVSSANFDLEDQLRERGEPIYQTRWGNPETVWGDVEKDTYDDYESFGYAARRIVYTHPPAAAASNPVAIVKADHDGTKHAILRDEAVADGTLLYAGCPSAAAESEGAVRFTGLVLKAHRNDGYPGDVDGDVLQRAALDCGLLEERTVAGPCGERCSCAETLSESEFPTICYFITEAGKAAIALTAEKEQPR